MPVLFSLSREFKWWWLVESKVSTPPLLMPTPYPLQQQLLQALPQHAHKKGCNKAIKPAPLSWRALLACKNMSSGGRVAWHSIKTSTA